MHCSLTTVPSFYPRSPCGERRSHGSHRGPHAGQRFYPRSPCGERPIQAPPYNLMIHRFYPRSPCGERRGWTLNINGPMKFLSTLSLRRATFSTLHNIFELFSVSIHALLAESDGDVLLSCFVRIMFLSTLSLRRATEIKDFVYLYNFSFYPRSPCGERRCGCSGRCRYWACFYPRSPCGERHKILLLKRCRPMFLSTLSLRRATNLTERLH